MAHRWERDREREALIVTIEELVVYFGEGLSSLHSEVRTVKALVQSISGRQGVEMSAIDDLTKAVDDLTSAVNTLAGNEATLIQDLKDALANAGVDNPAVTQAVAAIEAQVSALNTINQAAVEAITPSAPPA